MYPPVGLGQIRVNPKRDLTLAGGRVTLPAGTAVWVPHHAIQNTTHNWDQPEAFLPGARHAPCVSENMHTVLPSACRAKRSASRCRPETNLCTPSPALTSSLWHWLTTSSSSAAGAWQVAADR